MKLLIILIFIINGYLVNAQQNELKVKDLTWFGVDYSNANFISNKEFYYIDNSLFSQINQLIENEKNKFNFKEFYKKKNVIYSTGLIEERNKVIDLKLVISDNNTNTMHIQKEDIQKIIDTYNIPEDEKGLGLVFIAESYNKFYKKGFYYVTFFNISNKQVIYTERFDGKARGAGLRNRWANSLFYVLKKSTEKFEDILER